MKDLFTDQKPLRVDFLSSKFQRRLQGAGRKSELVARAVKAGEGRTVLDCTGGLGRDAFLLAYLGCRVTIVERSRVMSCLLEDGLRRAAERASLVDVVSRIVLHHADVLDVIADKPPFDVLYLDPMFPRKTGSALVGGDMQQMQRFLGTDQDASVLLQMALGTGCQHHSLTTCTERHMHQSCCRWRSVQVVSEWC